MNRNAVEQQEYRVGIRGLGKIQALAMMEVALELGGRDLMHEIDDELRHDLRSRAMPSPVTLSRLHDYDRSATKIVFERLDAWLDLNQEMYKPRTASAKLAAKRI